MNLLWLGPHGKRLKDYLCSYGDKVFYSDEPCMAETPWLKDKDYLISFGYSHILPRGVLQHFPQRAINIHISYLPWNRGADPNLWSFLEDTPKGVSIHYLTDQLDRGEILYQKETHFGCKDTLRSSYDLLIRTAEELFQCHWQTIREGSVLGRAQAPGGSFHRKKDADVYRHLLRCGWDTPVAELIGQALNRKGQSQ